MPKVKYSIGIETNVPRYHPQLDPCFPMIMQQDPKGFYFSTKDVQKLLEEIVAQKNPRPFLHYTIGRMKAGASIRGKFILSKRGSPGQ